MNLTGIGFVFIHAFLATIPGLGWAISLGYKRLFIIAFCISMALPIFSALIAKTLGLSFQHSTIIWAVFALIGWGFSTPKLKAIRPSLALIPYLVITLIWLLYSLGVGAYIDVPADFIFHTQFIETNLEAMQLGGFTEAPNLLKKANYYGHYLWAFELHFFGAEAWHLYHYLAFINALLFFFGIYSAGTWVFEFGRSTNFYALPLALFSAIFASFLFSVDAFSFARYYFIAPVITTFIGFLTAGLIGTALLRGEGNWVRDPVIIGIFSFWLILAHQQEFLFLVIMLFIVLILEAVRTDQNGERSMMLRSLALVAVIIAFATWLVVFIYGQRGPITTNKIIPLESILPFVKNLYIANPTYQFYQVMGPTGIITLGVLWLIRRDWNDNSWLFAAWLSPFLTLFNPFFVDFFLRQASEHVLWRMAFLTQLYFLFTIALFLLVRRAFSTEFTVSKRSLSLMALGAIMLSLVPMQGRYWNLTPNRFAGLISTPANTSPHHWDDLWYWLDRQEEHDVLTDPYTGYQVASFTHQNYQGYKFFNAQGFKEYRFSDYNDDPLRQYSGAWVIINMRDGGFSEMGETVGHWGGESLYVSNWYPSELLIHITSQPQNFTKKWQSEDDLILVYEIQYEH